jgi:hypothetical protein
MYIRHLTWIQATRYHVNISYDKVMGDDQETTWLDLNWDLAGTHRQYNQLHSHIIKVQRVTTCIVWTVRCEKQRFQYSAKVFNKKMLQLVHFYVFLLRHERTS